jgi:hypothetical protein
MKQTLEQMVFCIPDENHVKMNKIFNSINELFYEKIVDAGIL